MRYEFTLPDLGEGLTEAEIGRWLVSVGDTVAEDQAVVEVESAKAMVEISSPVPGIVEHLGAEPGEILPVGALLIAFDTEHGNTTTKPGAPEQITPRADDGASATDSLAAVGSPVGKRATMDTPPTSARHSRVLTSPSTRKYAVSLGIDLSQVTGSGPAGRVTREDVDRRMRESPIGAGATPGDGKGAVAAQRSPGSGGQSQRVVDEEVPLRSTRRQIARTLTQSWQQIPHITEFREVDATRLVEARRAIRDRLKESEGSAGLTFLPFLVLACTAALSRHRIFNATVDLDRSVITYRASVDVGIATSSTEGLVVPVLRGAATLGLLAIRDGIAELVESVRSRRVEAAQLSGGTFTISNFGSYGTWLGTPIINPPQAAIAGFGRIRDSVVAVDGQPVVRPTLPIAVSADHRIIDGHDLGAFVNDLATTLENPILLVGEMR